MISRADSIRHDDLLYLNEFHHDSKPSRSQYIQFKDNRSSYI